MLEHLLGPLEMASDAGRHRLQVANTLVGPTLQRLVAFFAQNRLAGLDSGGGDGLGHATRGGHDLRLVAVPATLLARGESVVDARLEVARQLSNTTWNPAQRRDPRAGGRAQSRKLGDRPNRVHDRGRR